MVFILLAKRLAISLAGINLSLLARIICASNCWAAVSERFFLPI